MTDTFRTSDPVSAAIDPRQPHLILVGLPGAGKSTVGAAVAERLGRTFLDLDREIERRQGVPISQIFAEKGEHFFRKLERELTQEIREFGGMVLSPGGGWITDPEVVALLRPPGVIVYLRVRPETAIKRLGPERATRPLLMRPDPVGELKRLFDQRRAAYETADHTIDTETLDVQGVVEKITQLASGLRGGYVSP